MSYGPEDSWLIPFLNQLRARPAVVLRDERVQTLDTFIYAYTQAREDLGFPPFGRSESTILCEFERWLAVRLEDNREVSWPTLVTSVDPGDRNVRTFFRLFDQFMNERPETLSLDAGSRWPPDGWHLDDPRRE